MSVVANWQLETYYVNEELVWHAWQLQLGNEELIVQSEMVQRLMDLKLRRLLGLPHTRRCGLTCKWATTPKGSQG